MYRIRIVARSSRLLHVMANNAFGEIAEDLISYGAGPAGVIDRGDLLAATAADEHHFVANLHAGNTGDIADGQVHGNAAEHRRAPAVKKHVTSGREAAIQAVTIAGCDDGD